MLVDPSTLTGDNSVCGTLSKITWVIESNRSRKIVIVGSLLSLKNKETSCNVMINPDSLTDRDSECNRLFSTVVSVPALELAKASPRNV
jgi:hypothetical protein